MEFTQVLDPASVSNRVEPRGVKGPGSADSLGLSFPQMCIDLGWMPKYGHFNVVTLVLQPDSHNPELFEIPLDLVGFEVTMEYPK